VFSGNAGRATGSVESRTKDKKDAQMKTIALSMIFSLAVIVCEQQTLFAPHYSDWNGAKRTAVSKSSSQNSLVPVAGVDRLVPLAGTGDSLIAIIAIAAAQRSEYFYGTLSRLYSDGHGQS
jgi:hypothetical protein